MKPLIPHYAATFIKPKDLEKQDLDDDDVWSPTSDFEVNYVMRQRKKNERLDAAEYAARDATAALAVGPTEAMEEALRVMHQPSSLIESIKMRKEKWWLE